MRIYEVDYPRLSWYVHSGVTGVINLKSETFVHLCANAFSLAADSYREVLEAIVRKFKIDKAISKIDLKLYAAKAFPFNDDPEIEEDITGTQYGFSSKQQIQLEKKEDLKKRGLASPDIGDCLAMSFSVKVAPKERKKPQPSYTPLPAAAPSGWSGSLEN